MSEPLSKLVAMSNQIARFFESQGDADAAAEAVAAHLRDFWTPRMRQALIAHNQAGGEGLTPAARSAVTALARG